MIKLSIFVAFALYFGPSAAMAQNIDCSVIKNNPASRAKCEQAEQEARRYELQKQHYQLREQKIKEAVGDTARLAAQCVRSKSTCVKEALRPKSAQ